MQLTINIKRPNIKLPKLPIIIPSRACLNCVPVAIYKDAKQLINAVKKHSPITITINK